MTKVKIRSLSFLAPGSFHPDQPADGLDDTIRLFEYAESLGYDAGWVRQRHLWNSLPSAAVFLAAVSQRTSRIRLGTGVIPLGFESLFRVAEDLSVLDALSRGRVEAGVSRTAPSPYREFIGSELYPGGDWSNVDESYERVGRFVELLRNPYLGEPDQLIKLPSGEHVRPQRYPFVQGLAERVWISGIREESAIAAGQLGLNYQIAMYASASDRHTIEESQAALARTYLDNFAGRSPRILLGKVLYPIDNATPSQRKRFEEIQNVQFVSGQYRITPIAPRFDAPDLLGSSDEILEKLSGEPALPLVNDLRIELPYNLTLEEYQLIIHDIAAYVAPGLGWTPAGSREPEPAEAGIAR